MAVDAQVIKAAGHPAMLRNQAGQLTSARGGAPFQVQQDPLVI
jgi:hypothetical protein